MDWGESGRMGWRSIRAHRLRSVLTTLGVIIGVGAVIAFVVLGASLQGGVVGEFADQQSPSMMVTTSSGEDGFGGFGGGGQAVFTEHDIDRIQELEDVSTVLPEASVSISAIRRGDQTLSFQSLQVQTAASFDQPGSGNFSDGGPFTDGEREVVVNEHAATMFAENVTVGETLTFERGDRGPINVTVVGIRTGDGGFPGPGGAQPAVIGPIDPFYDTTITSPTTGDAQRVYPQLTVVATGFEEVAAVEERVDAYLQDESDASTLLPDAYSISVVTTAGIIDQIEEVIGTLTQFIVGIAVISLVVGAIGIANIMLVSVTERTREIGIMKAVGAQRRDILQLFLVEATMLGTLGALAGAVVGGAVAALATHFIGLPYTFPVSWAAIAILMGVLVGIVSGLYPAWNAARTDPIDALRYE